MAFDNNFIDELKTRVNIVDVIGREVSLKKAGSSYKACARSTVRKRLPLT